MVKKNVNFQAEDHVIEEFDKTLKDYEATTGISLKKGNCLEIAMKEYLKKLKQEIESKKETPTN